MNPLLPASIRLSEPALSFHLRSGFLDYQVGVAIGQSATRISFNAVHRISFGPNWLCIPAYEGTPKIG
jgi:hypothetical protein